MLNGKKSTMRLGAAVFALAFTDVTIAQTYYGSQLMAPRERSEHRAIMRSLPPGEREDYRAQHHEDMKKRAESMGLSLPDQPPAHGRGFYRRGPGYGYGRWGVPRGYEPGYGNRGYPDW
jgi:hypothetical protein